MKVKLCVWDKRRREYVTGLFSCTVEQVFGESGLLLPHEANVILLESAGNAKAGDWITVSREMLISGVKDFKQETKTKVRRK